MTMKITLSALALALAFAPGLVLAQGCHQDPTRITASACGDTMVWDTKTQSCVEKPST